MDELRRDEIIYGDFILKEKDFLSLCNWNQTHLGCLLILQVLIVTSGRWTVGRRNGGFTFDEDVGNIYNESVCRFVQILFIEKFGVFISILQIPKLT